MKNKQVIFIVFFVNKRNKIMHEQPVKNLKITDITSEVFTIAPTQMEYIATLIGDNVADNMNMRAFAPKIRTIALQALKTALNSARHMGEKAENKSCFS